VSIVVAIYRETTLPEQSTCQIPVFRGVPRNVPRTQNVPRHFNPMMLIFESRTIVRLAYQFHYHLEITGFAKNEAAG
jgi:hypothetical protein